ncbi:MAG: hypothetical protein ACPGSC_14875, partial [Granulosicoccaceae bacterium]
LAGVRWHVPPRVETSLSVLAIDATGSHLQPGHFEQDSAVLEKMLAAIGVELRQCALGGLCWDEPSERALSTPFSLVLVDSGEDAAALIGYWRDKLLSLHGSRGVVAPHPRMFDQGVALKRQAWSSLQMLQNLWTD